MMTRRLHRLMAGLVALAAASAPLAAQSARIDGGVVSTDSYGFIGRRI